MGLVECSPGVGMAECETTRRHREVGVICLISVAQSARLIRPAYSLLSATRGAISDMFPLHDRSVRSSESVDTGSWAFFQIL